VSEETLAASTGEDAGEVRHFFDQWHVYKRVVTLNYLHHREAYAALEEALGRFDRPIRFLDLGAGDAAWSSQVLRARKLARYEAVDLSPVALDLARQNIAELNCETAFTVGDFCDALRSGSSEEDVIFIGLSFHHLPLADKAAMLPVIRRRLAAGGSLICYEPINEEGESRAQVLDRWWQEVLRNWTELTPDELSAVHDHVFGNDYPECCGTYARLAAQAGFAETRILYRDPQALYAVIECRA
jgi:ubiquinone/menaquinone biosynthesis C-methylase UbiE